jgi:SRSO17 transposase
MEFLHVRQTVSVSTGSVHEMMWIGAARMGGRDRSFRLWRRRQSATRWLKSQDTKYCHTEKHDAQSHNPQQRDVKAHEDMSRGSMLVMPIVATSVDTTVLTNPRGDLRSKTRASYQMISVEQRRRVSRRLCQTRGVQTKSLRIPKSLGRQQFGAEGNYSKLRYAWN